MRIRLTRANARRTGRAWLVRHARTPVALVVAGVLGLVGGLQAAAPASGKCPPKNPHCQTATSTTTPTTTATTTIPTTTTAPTTGSWPAQWRFAYSNRADQALMPTYGYNLIDATTKDEADAVPPGTHAQVWLFDYDNRTCTWEKDDAYVRNAGSSMANEPHVGG